MDNEQPAAAPQPNQPFTPLTAIPDTARETGGWSWGAFMFGPYFLVAIRNYALLWVYLLLFVPILNGFVWLGMMIYLGVKGRALAATSHTFSNRDEYRGFMNGFDHAGKVFAVVTLVVLVLMIVVFGSIVGGMIYSLSNTRTRQIDTTTTLEERNVQTAPDEYRYTNPSGTQLESTTSRGEATQPSVSVPGTVDDNTVVSSTGEVQ